MSINKPDRIEAVILQSVRRELAKMITDGTEEIDRWKPDALASWIVPGIVRSVKRHLSKPKGKRR